MATSKGNTVEIDEDGANFFINFLNKKLRAQNKKLREIENLEKSAERNEDQEKKIKGKKQVLDSIQEIERTRKLYNTSLEEQFPSMKESKGSKPGTKSEKPAKVEPQVTEVEKIVERIVIQKEDTSKIIRKILDLVHLAQYVNKSSKKKEFIHDISNIAELDVEAINEFFEKVFGFPPSRKFERIREKLESAAAELSLYLEGSTKQAVGSKTYQGLSENVELITTADIFLNHKIEIEQELLIREDSNNLPAIGSEVTNKSNAKQHHSPQQVISNVTQSIVTPQEDEEEEEGRTSFKPDEDEEIKPHNESKNPAEEYNPGAIDQGPIPEQEVKEVERRSPVGERRGRGGRYNRGGGRSGGRGGRYYRGGRGGYDHHYDHYEHPRNDEGRDPSQKREGGEDTGFIEVKGKFKIPPNAGGHRYYGNRDDGQRGYGGRDGPRAHSASGRKVDQGRPYSARENFHNYEKPQQEGEQTEGNEGENSVGRGGFRGGFRGEYRGEYRGYRGGERRGRGRGRGFPRGMGRGGFRSDFGEQRPEGEEVNQEQIEEQENQTRGEYRGVRRMRGPRGGAYERGGGYGRGGYERGGRGDRGDRGGRGRRSFRGDRRGGRGNYRKNENEINTDEGHNEENL